MDTARSPYTAVIHQPSLFTLALEVFHQVMTDRVQNSVDVEPPEIMSFVSDRAHFAGGESVQLKWSLKSVSGFEIENLNKEKDVVKNGCAVVFPHTNHGIRTTSYTLRANGYKNKAPYSCSASVTLTETYWKKEGPATGYFSGGVYRNTAYNSRIFAYGGKLFCYAHSCLLRRLERRTALSVLCRPETDFIL